MLALGVRHARRAVLGLGALVVVASVALPGWLSLTRDSSHKAMIARDAARAAWWQANPVADWLSGALAAQWLPSLVVLAAGSLLFWLAVRVIAPTAWHIAITSDEPLRKAPAPGLVRRFAGGLPWLLTVKEWRAVLRNPAEWLGLLINIVLVVVGVKLFLKGSSTDVQLATSLVATIGLLAARLMPVFIGAEEAPTLLASAPVARNRLLLLKVNAALLPLAVLVLLASLTLLFGYGWQAALVGGVAALLAAFSTAVISVARPYRIQRKSFQSTGWPEGFKAADLLAQAVLQLAWPLLALVCLNGYWWAALGGAALLLVPLWSYWKDFETETILGY